jgi:23S rRNA (guanosine2251-2'-O)-methyltransferase
MTQPTRLVVGFHAVTACLRQRPEAVLEVFVHEQRRDPRLRELAQTARARGVKVVPVDVARLEGLAGGTRHQGVVARVTGAAAPRDLDSVLGTLTQPALLLLLDGVTDPHNLGACLRVADAMGAHAVVVPKDRCVGLTPTVVKVASGAAESVPLITVTNLARTIEGLQEQGIWVLGAAAEGGQSLEQAQLTGPIAWVMGAEGTGLRRLTRELCDALVRIPMYGTVDSLNVSVAAALCLYETRRQRRREAGATAGGASDRVRGP